MDSLSPFQIFTLVANLLSMSMAGGLAFAVLVQPQRKANNYLFALFLVMMGFWAVTSLFINTPPNWGAISGVLLLRMRVTVLGMLVLTYYLFVIAFIQPRGQIVRGLTLAAVIIVPVFLIATWTGGMYTNPNAIAEMDGSRPEFSAIGYLMLGLAVGYLLLSFWLIWSSDKDHALLLRVPTIMLILAYGSLIPEDTTFAAFDTFLVTFAAVWIGWAVMRHQVFNPLNELNTEMRTANRDLQQVINDLAAEKSRTEALNVELRASNAYKSEFLANMSHELRTPLNSIIGYSELLQKGIYGGLNEKQTDRLEKIFRNGVHLLRVISDILDLNKIESGKLRLDTEFFDFSHMALESDKEYQDKAKAKGLTLSTAIPADLPKLYADPIRVRQVLDNLLDNAIKFTKEGEVKLEARAVSVAKGISSGFNLPTIGWLRDGNWVVFNVTDSGIGIAPENQARIFEEFSQVDGSHTREFGGTGLGLAISKKLIEMHDGTIWVKSRLEEGSTFFVALPADLKEGESTVNSSSVTSSQAQSTTQVM